MNKKQCERFRNLAVKGQITDLDYANQLIITLCDELTEKNIITENLREQIKNRPITYPHHCCVLSSRGNQEEIYLFIHKYEAELFRISRKNPEDYQIKTMELFQNHKSALFKNEHQFLKSVVSI